MQKFRSFITIAFLLASVITILLIAIFDNMLQLLAVDLINHYLIPTIIVLLIFVVLLSAGIVSNSHRSEGSLIGNGYFQTGYPRIISDFCRAGLFPLLYSAAW